MTTKTMATKTKEKPTFNKNDTIIRPIPVQRAFIASKARYPAFIGGWGTGKSLCGICRAMRLSEGHENNLGAIFRKEYTDLKDSTIKDFEIYTGLGVNSSREVDFPNGSIIMFRHLEELNNIQNINLGWFWIEQAEELETDEIFFMLFGRLRRKGMPHSGFITANTRGRNWIHKLWKAGKLENGELYEAKTHDNEKNLSPEFLKSLEILKKRKPSIYSRFVENSWEDSDTADLIINSQWIDKAREKDLNIQPPIRKIITIDVARYGDDKTVFYALEQGARKETFMIDKQSWEKKNTMETVGLAVIFAKKNGIKAFAVDEIGVGAGVADRLTELGYQVIYVNSSRKSTQPQKFYNTRAEIYDNAANLLESEKIDIDPEDEDLVEELNWIKYKAIKSNGVFQIESKEDIKKRLGRSPDCADAFVNGLWAVEQVDVITEKDKYRLREERDAVIDEDPMAL